MSSRVTQALLAAIGVLLAAHLLVSVGMIPRAQAQPAAPVQEVVRAKLIELVSAGGQVVAQLHTAEDGAGQLRLRSGNGAVRVKLGASADGSALILMDSETKPAVWLAADRSGTKVTLAQRGKNHRVLVP
jgi:hypothetical protein